MRQFLINFSRQVYLKICQKIHITLKTHNFVGHPVNKEGRKRKQEKEEEKEEKERGLKVEAKAAVDVARSERTKATSRQFLTGGKICKCAQGRPTWVMPAYLGRSWAQ